MNELSQVLLPVNDVDAALAFYEQALGMALAFRDGDRYAALQAGGVKIALAAPAERAPEAGLALAIKVADLDAATQRLHDAGIAVPEPTLGGHERSIEVRDPDGNAVLFYQPLPRG